MTSEEAWLAVQNVVLNKMNFLEREAFKIVLEHPPLGCNRVVNLITEIDAYMDPK